MGTKEQLHVTGSTRIDPSSPLTCEPEDVVHATVSWQPHWSLIPRSTGPTLQTLDYHMIYMYMPGFYLLGGGGGGDSRPNTPASPPKFLPIKFN